nr:MAG TPA: hypothetical protein [Caudoviricetes sp.]
MSDGMRESVEYKNQICWSKEGRTTRSGTNPDAVAVATQVKS